MRSRPWRCFSSASSDLRRRTESSRNGTTARTRGPGVRVQGLEPDRHVALAPRRESGCRTGRSRRGRPGGAGRPAARPGAGGSRAWRPARSSSSWARPASSRGRAGRAGPSPCPVMATRANRSWSSAPSYSVRKTRPSRRAAISDVAADRREVAHVVGAEEGEQVERGACRNSRRSASPASSIWHSLEKTSVQVGVLVQRAGEGAQGRGVQQVVVVEDREEVAGGVLDRHVPGAADPAVRPAVEQRDPGVAVGPLAGGGEVVAAWGCRRRPGSIASAARTGSGPTGSARGGASAGCCTSA